MIDENSELFKCLSMIPQEFSINDIEEIVASYSEFETHYIWVVKFAKGSWGDYGWITGYKVQFDWQDDWSNVWSNIGFYDPEKTIMNWYYHSEHYQKTSIRDSLMADLTDASWKIKPVDTKDRYLVFEIEWNFQEDLTVYGVRDTLEAAYKLAKEEEEKLPSIEKFTKVNSPIEKWTYSYTSFYKHYTMYIMKV